MCSVKAIVYSSLIAASLFLATVARAQDNGPPGPGGGGGDNYDCSSCYSHGGWGPGPLMWYCEPNPNGSGSGCQGGFSGCTYTGGCVSLPEPPVYQYGLSL